MNQPVPMLSELLAEALQTLAFVSIEPLEWDCAPPANTVLVRVPFTGPHAGGALEMATCIGLGELLALNLMVLTPGGEPGANMGVATDALKELANVTCGLVLRNMEAAGSIGPFEMGLPHAAPLGPSLHWPPFIADAEAQLFSAEGNPVAIRLRGAA